MRHWSRKILSVAALFTIGQGSLSAQQLQATRMHFSTDDGLCSNSISMLTQDDLGYIWIATWNGLARFDGYNFYNYQTGAGSHIPNLHNRILSLTVDNQQNIWLRMYDNRVFMMKRAIDKIINPFEGISGNEEFRTSCSIMSTSNGDVLVSIDGTGIYRFKPEQNQFSRQLITTSGLVITSMAEGYKGDIWLGTDKGVHRMDPSNLTVERKGHFTSENITCLVSNGYNVYAGTKDGNIVTFAYGSEDEVIRQGDQPITALFVDSHGLIWFSDNRHGVLCHNPQTKIEKLYQQNVTLPDYDGYGAFFNESNGYLWVRMNHGGYGYYNRETDEIEYFHNNPINPWNLSNTVNASLELPEGVIFETTARRGLEKMDIMKKTIERKMLVESSESNLENETRAMYYDKERHMVLIGNKASRLFFFNEAGQLLHTITTDDHGNSIGRAYGLSKDSKGNYWMASKDHGLYRITPTSSGGYSVTNIYHDDNDINTLSSNSAYATVEDKKGNIWVATYGGGVNVITRDREGKQVVLHSKNGMPEYPYHSFMKVRTITTDKEGNVWAGSTDGILIMSENNGQVSIKKLLESEQYPDSILLSNDIVCLGQSPKGVMWIGTNGGGIACITGKDKQGRYLFHNYGVHDGLPGEEIKNLTFDSKGNVWFSTDNTICSFNIEKNIFSTYSSIDGVDDTMCSEGAAITLGNDNVLIGTTNGYYVVERKKLVNNNSSALKLRITDFWLNEVLQSPRFNSTFEYYVPESREITLKSHSALVTLRFASLNYQLQHRVHYQYKMEGYDKGWLNADKTRTVSYPGLPTGKYKFKVKAFLLESPDSADVRELTIIVPPHFFLSSNAIWLYMALAALFFIRLLFWRQRQIRMRMAPYEEVVKMEQQSRFHWLKPKNKKEAPKVDDTDDYVLLD